MNITIAQLKRMAKMEPSRLKELMDSFTPNQLNSTIKKCKDYIKQYDDELSDKIGDILGYCSLRDAEIRIAHALDQTDY